MHVLWIINYITASQTQGNATLDFNLWSKNVYQL